MTNIGSQHPVPENIPHLTATSPGANNPTAGNNGGSISAQGGQHIPGSISSHPGSVGFQSRSPVKEGSFLHRGRSADESENAPETEAAENKGREDAVSPPPATEGVPIRR